MNAKCPTNKLVCSRLYSIFVVRLGCEYVVQSYNSVHIYRAEESTHAHYIYTMSSSLCSTSRVESFHNNQRESMASHPKCHLTQKPLDPSILHCCNRSSFYSDAATACFIPNSKFQETMHWSQAHTRDMCGCHVQTRQ